MALVGADPDGLDRLAALIGRTAARIDEAQRDIGRRLDSAAWRGADAELARAEWRQRGVPGVHGLRSMLAACATDLRSHAAAQRQASALGPGVPGVAVMPLTAGGDRSSVPQLEDLEVSARWEGFDESLGWGDPDWTLEDGSPAGFAGVVASGEAGVELNGDGLRADASGRAGALAEVQGGVVEDYGDLQGRAALEVTADAEGAVTVDDSGVTAKVGAHALAGATVGGSWDSPEVAGVQAGAEGSFNAGIGFDANAGVALTDDHLKLKVKLGATLGIGGSTGVNIDIQPKEALESLNDGLDDLHRVFD